MENGKPNKRLLEILDLITEVSLGNYTYNLELKNHKNDLEQIALSLNMMVEEVATVVHQIDHEKSHEVIENIALQLDKNYRITSYSKNLTEILNYKPEEILARPITSFLTSTSIEKIFPNKVEKAMRSIDNIQHPHTAELIHKSGYLWKGNAYLHELNSRKNKSYILSVFKSVYRNEKLLNALQGSSSSTPRYPSEYRSLLLQDKRNVLDTLHNYILQRLDRNLPKMKIIARDVGGSPSKLKAMFKEAYDETIFAYHKKKRLEKALQLLKDSPQPIGIIAQDCGFVSFPHFSRAFKKMFGISPSQIRKF